MKKTVKKTAPKARPKKADNTTSATYPFQIAVNTTLDCERVIADTVIGNDRYIIYIPKHERC